MNSVVGIPLNFKFFAIPAPSPTKTCNSSISSSSKNFLDVLIFSPPIFIGIIFIFFHP